MSSLHTTHHYRDPKEVFTLRLVLARLGALIINFLFAIVVGSFGIALLKAPSIWDSVFKTIRIEAETFNRFNYKVLEKTEASGGRLVSTPTTGNLEGVFPGPTARYDVVIAANDLFDWQSERGSRILVRIGDSDHVIVLANSEGGLIRKTFVRGISVESGTPILIEGLTTNNEFASIDYLDFVPSSSNAFRPNDNEKAFRFGTFFHAIGYDDMNLHFTSFYWFCTLFILELISLALFRGDLGHYLCGLSIITHRGVPGIWSSLRYSFGSFLGVIFCGLGWIWVFFSPYQQSWSNLLSGTFVIPRDSYAGEHIADNAAPVIFERPGAFLGRHREVPFSLLLVAFITDIILVAIILVASLMVVNRDSFRTVYNDVQRIEGEKFVLTGFRYDKSIWASGAGYAKKTDRESRGKASAVFTGPRGTYHLIAGIHRTPAESRVLSLYAGQSSTRFSFSGSGSYEALPVLQSIELLPGAEIKIAGVPKSPVVYNVKLDYLDVVPESSDYPISRTPYTRLSRIQKALNLQSQTIQFLVLFGIPLGYILYYSCAVSYCNRTLGMFCSGFGIYGKNTSRVSFSRASLRIPLLVISKILFFLGLGSDAKRITEKVTDSRRGFSPREGL